MKQLNDEVLIALQIEHRDAVENLPDILSVPGIDAAFVGPEIGRQPRETGADRSSRRGASRPPRDRRVQRQASSRIHTGSVDKAKHWIDQGMKFVGFEQTSSSFFRSARAL